MSDGLTGRLIQTNESFSPTPMSSGKQESPSVTMHPKTLRRFL